VAGTINATGTLAAKHDMPIASVGEGGQVRRCWSMRATGSQGQLLAVIDRSVQVEQDANQQAGPRGRGRCALAQANLDRALKLVDRGFISKADIDKLTATARCRRCARPRGAGQLGETRARIRRLTIVAPADGLVLDRMVEPGQVVGGGRARCSALPNMARWKCGAPVRNRSGAYGAGAGGEGAPVGTDQTFIGHVWQVSPVIDAATRQGWRASAGL
jgi:hypothetical protein